MSLKIQKFYEELSTLLFEIERIVNYRHITYLYPNHLESYVTTNLLLFGCQLEYSSSNHETNTFSYEFKHVFLNTVKR